MLKQEADYKLETEVISKDDTRIPVEITGRVAEINGHRIALGFFKDISKRKQNEDRMRMVSQIWLHTKEGVMITDVKRVIVEMNQAFTDITGYTREEVIGRNPNIMNSGRHDAAFY